MSKPAVKYKIPVPHGLAILLSTAALALVLSAPAHAQVSVDYSQLDGTGAPAPAPAYDNRHSVQSPLVPGQAAALEDETPTIIGGKIEQSKPPTVAAPKSAIALKPLPQWDMPVPAQPISLGARAPLLLHPPGSANPAIADLAKQSPVENTKTAELHLRPPAPKPPMPTYAQNGADIAPPVQTMVAPPVTTQMASNPIVPMPMTQIGMSVNPVSVPLPQTQVAETTMTAPVPPQTQIAMAQPVPMPLTTAAQPQQNDLRAEDVVALDLGVPKHDEAPDVSPVVAAPSKQSDAEPVAPPQTSAPPVKTASSGSPQFVSSLAEEDVPPDHNNTNNNPHQDADVLPPPVLRAPESSAPQADNNKTDDHKFAAAAPPSFTGSLSDDEDLPPAKPAPAVAAKPVVTATAQKPQFTSSMGQDGPPADNAMMQDAAATASDADMKMGYLHEPAGKSQAAAAKEAKADVGAKESAFVSSLDDDSDTTAGNPAPQKTMAAALPSDQTVATAKKIGTLKEPAKKATVTAAADAPPDTITWNNTPAAAASVVAAVNDNHASAQQAAETVSDTIAQDDSQKKKEDELAHAQADAKSKADALAKMQADAAAKAQADAVAKAQAEAELKVQAEAKAKAEAETKTKSAELAAAQAEAKAKADELAKAQADAAAKTQADAALQAATITKVQADADARTKTQMDVMAKAQADELAKVQAEADANKERLAQLMQRQAEIEAQAKAESSMTSASQDQIKTAAAVPMQPVAKTEVMELPKVVEKSPVREAAISTGTLNDVSGAAAGSTALVQQTLLFQPGTSVVPGDAAPTIQQLAQNMKNNTAARLVINAYADTSVQAGSAARRLSLQRAILVRDELNRRGVPVNRMAVRAQTSDPGTINPDRVEISVE